MKTVLIADDRESIRLLVKATIESDQFTVIEAADGAAAWDLIQEACPSLVLLDIHMPRRSGLDLTRAIKGDPTLQGIKVILITANGQAQEVAVGLEAGADRYLTKPFSPVELMLLVAELLGEAAPFAPGPT
jgi:twitching motility two-component system response regulator PilH